ncbi:zinc-binding dehydrogenase [Halalkalibacter nanhaiisediminis]|uniref:Zinc-binding alcohol dehydrogenase/oxidoreductase n=1 Tax=Halalkalibacter nanhaiisediminis TaxID=688079 RepID=A0A562QQV9_9BACI|nr:zinc-binding dehydrogenase [Halalkalibacter nanhaiisediminis]TWI59141.1 zinc-binding alcohol dehydrogenase/oxidoreductase [Halalkalibacter nanhaiisediminis]
MKAFIHKGEKGLKGTAYQEIEEKQPAAGEVRIRLIYAGLNHRDLFVLERHKENEPALIIGSDGAGIIEEIGSGVEGFHIGNEVIINPSLGWINKSSSPPEGFEVLGLPDHGTFAEKITISAANIEPKPKHLNWEEAGVLSLAALTAYRALISRANVKPNDTVLLPGVGSGAVTFLLLFAKAIGCRVIVTSRSEEKRKKALKLGADVAINSASNWEEALKGEKVDVVIETVGAATFNQSIHQLKKGGTIVTFGASAGDEVTINIRNFFYGQFNMLGTTMGSRDEFREMLHFISRYNIKPVMDKVFPLSEATNALLRMNEAEQFGKIALKIGNEPN